MRRGVGPLAVLAVLLPALASNPFSTPDTTPIKPQIPLQDRNAAGRIFLERADSLVVLPELPDVQIVMGNVMFRKGDMFVYCDSALFYTSPSLPADSMEAFGNIRMEQGDTLFLYGDAMEYSGTEQLATVYGEGMRDVRLINRDVMLTAPILHYSMEMNLGFYENGGTLTDPKNTLTSLEGEYAPPTKEANFYNGVELTGVSNKGDSVWVYTDTLLYNTDTRIAELPIYARILSKDGTIHSNLGIFDTGENIATLLDRSLVHTRQGNTITGDSLVYDRALGIGEAFGDMVLTDSARQMTLTGDYGFYNELADSSYVTGHALAMEHSRPDTLYLHGEVIRSFLAEDSTHLMVAAPKVRFWRVDLQGVCDSMTFVEADTTLRMDVDPVVWSDNRQIFGNRIVVHMNDSTLDWARLPDFGFMAEQIEGTYFNQLSGREMLATFEDGELRQLDVSGSVQAVMLPQEEDSTYNKVANIESSFMTALFRNREIERAHLWNETSGTVTPLYLAKKSLFRLPKFQWLIERRPRGPWDLMPAEEAVAAGAEVIEGGEDIGQGGDGGAGLGVEESGAVANAGAEAPLE